MPTNGDRARRPRSSESKGKRLNPIKRQQMEDRLREIEERDCSRPKLRLRCVKLGFKALLAQRKRSGRRRNSPARKNDLRDLMKEWEELSGTLA